jgi:positive regulator of sigma E activity
MYFLNVCLFTIILTFHVLFKHEILWIVLHVLEIVLRFPLLNQNFSKHCFTKRRNPQYYYVGVLHSRMQNKCSAINADLFHANLIVNFNCLCGHHN